MLAATQMDFFIVMSISRLNSLRPYCSGDSGFINAKKICVLRHPERLEASESIELLGDE